MAIDGRVFAVPEMGGLFCLDGKNGNLLWFTPKITQFVSVSPTRVYAVDQLGRLSILDSKTGTRLASMPLDGVTIKLINNECDRIFLANSAGVVQCLRETELRSPVVYIRPPAEKTDLVVKMREKKEKPASTAADEEAAADGDEAPARDAEKPDADADSDSDPDPFK